MVMGSVQCLSTIESVLRSSSYFYPYLPNNYPDPRRKSVRASEEVELMPVGPRSILFPLHQSEIKPLEAFLYPPPGDAPSKTGVSNTRPSSTGWLSLKDETRSRRSSDDMTKCYASLRRMPSVIYSSGSQTFIRLGPASPPPLCINLTSQNPEILNTHP
ncbi:hypothetical protein TNCV_486941 [Trichonephila clavipes]|nr:hypothetical protein TNCV_486941 [Trichonephila clavipes]